MMDDEEALGRSTLSHTKRDYNPEDNESMSGVNGGHTAEDSAHTITCCRTTGLPGTLPGWCRRSNSSLSRC
jgi:hypothetical protein